MESKLATTIVKRCNDGTEEASILGESGPSLVGTPSGASKSENPPSSFSLYDIPIGVYRTCIAVQFRLGSGHLHSGLGKPWKTIRKVRVTGFCKRALRIQKCFERPLTRGLGNWDSEELWANYLRFLPTSGSSTWDHHLEHNKLNTW